MFIHIASPNSEESLGALVVVVLNKLLASIVSTRPVASCC